ncbi:DoxX family protein [Fulvivirgaceae bacterium PWU4]|uniref:DoxX family protein n=1 Tax=Chryseosolibacter histidini TaxID=2782349 RepID=A0AAP2GSW9_9BACT|nr:DoxX family protein [Chryseosolibacter histidini]MBT1701032.1 DoxX family protein [Chryseosolibacter histidini]
MGQQKTSKALNVVLWATQILLAVTFLWAGSMKIFKPGALPWPWVKENPGLVTITGVVDLLAGLGLVLPALLRIQPRLTVYAAYGTILLMIAASIFHISRGEGSQIGFNIFVLVCAIFIAWGRQTKAPITSK